MPRVSCLSRHQRERLRGQVQAAPSSRTSCKCCGTPSTHARPSARTWRPSARSVLRDADPADKTKFTHMAAKCKGVSVWLSRVSCLSRHQRVRLHDGVEAAPSSRASCRCCGTPSPQTGPSTRTWRPSAKARTTGRHPRRQDQVHAHGGQVQRRERGDDHAGPSLEGQGCQG